MYVPTGSGGENLEAVNMSGTVPSSMIACFFSEKSQQKIGLASSMVLSYTMTAGGVEMDIFEQLEVVFSERRSEALKQSSKFREYTLEEEKLYTKLKESKSDDQQKLFEGYLITASATQATVESLSYKQGMIDLLAFLKCIEYREED